MMKPWVVLFKLSGPGQDPDTIHRQDYVLPAEATEEQQRNMATALANLIFEPYQAAGATITIVAVIPDERAEQLLLTIENLRNTINSFNNQLN